MSTVQAAGIKLITICNAPYTLTQLAQPGLAVIVPRLPAPNCQPPVMPARLCVPAEAVLQLVVLAGSGRVQSAGCKLPFVKSAVLFMLAVAVLQMALCWLAVAVSRLRYFSVFTLASGIGSNPAGIVLAAVAVSGCRLRYCSHWHQK